MKFKNIYALGLMISLLSFSVMAEEAVTSEKTLDEKLSELNFPANEVPANFNSDKLYSVQDRLISLKGKHEFAVDGGKNLNIDGNFSSNQTGLVYRHHLTNRWAWGLNGYMVANELSASGTRLKNEKSIVGDIDYVKSQYDLIAEYNLFYGKFRLSMDRVLYFDQYIAFGPSMINLSSGTTYGAVADIGFVFWLGKSASFRFGVKNDMYQEKTQLDGKRFNNNIIGHVAVGYMFGGK